MKSCTVLFLLIVVLCAIPSRVDGEMLSICQLYLKYYKNGSLPSYEEEEMQRLRIKGLC